MIRTITAGQTDGRAIAYSALNICYMLLRAETVLQISVVTPQLLHEFIIPRKCISSDKLVIFRIKKFCYSKLLASVHLSLCVCPSHGCIIEKRWRSDYEIFTIR